jgi:hypothetical protein
MKMGRNKRRRRGATLVLVTTIGVIVAILSLSMVELGYHARLLAVRDVEKVSARCAADAGVAQAFLQMQQKLIRAHQNQPFNWSGPIGPGSGTLEGDNASYSYQVSEYPGYYWEVISTGTCNLATKTVHAILALGSYAEGVGVDKTFDAKNSSYFGIVGPGTIQDMNIRSNSTSLNAMIFRTNVRVDGDVLCGPGGDPVEVVEPKQGVTFAGQVGASSYTMVWPDISVPDNLVSGPAITGSVVLPYGRYAYTGLTIPNLALIQIAKDVVNVPPRPTVIYVQGIMRLNQGAEIRVLSGASLELYIGQQLVSGNSVGFGNENNYAATLKIFGLPTCTYIDLKTSSNTFACVYAPNADVDLYNSQNFYGSIVADSFEMKNSGNFYFDTKLKQVTIDDLLARFVIARWWEG